MSTAIVEALAKVVPADLAQNYAEDFSAVTRLLLRGYINTSAATRIRDHITAETEDAIYVYSNRRKKGVKR